MSITAGLTFYGIVYLRQQFRRHVHGGLDGEPVAARRHGVQEQRRRGVLGALVADGGGCLLVGSNSLNVKYDANVFNSVTSYGTVGLVQNTWRELKAGS